MLAVSLQAIRSSGQEGSAEAQRIQFRHESDRYGEGEGLSVCQSAMHHTSALRDVLT